MQKLFSAIINVLISLFFFQLSTKGQAVKNGNLQKLISYHSQAKLMFHALVLTEKGGIQEGFVLAALDWLKEFSSQSNFDFTIIYQADSRSDNYLSHCKVFIQLNYPTYRWSDISKASFTRYIEEGRGGWVGFHHAPLPGGFGGYSMWEWYSKFMGRIRQKVCIVPRTPGTLIVEDQKHPVIWTNEKMKARNVYFQMGHHANIFHSAEFKRMFGNAILWAAGK